MEGLCQVRMRLTLGVRSSPPEFIVPIFPPMVPDPWRWKTIKCYNFVPVKVEVKTLAPSRANDNVTKLQLHLGNAEGAIHNPTGQRDRGQQRLSLLSTGAIQWLYIRKDTLQEAGGWRGDHTGWKAEMLLAMLMSVKRRKWQKPTLT